MLKGLRVLGLVYPYIILISENLSKIAKMVNTN